MTKYKQITKNDIEMNVAMIWYLHHSGIWGYRNMTENGIVEKWVSIEEAANHLGVKPVTIRDWIRKGKDIPAHKIGKQWKFRVSELDSWVQSGQSADI